MHRIDLQDAEGRLADLMDEVASGEEVVITRGDGVSCKMVLVHPATSRPTFGSARGWIEIADNFDAPLEDFWAYEP